MATESRVDRIFAAARLPQFAPRQKGGKLMNSKLCRLGAFAAGGLLSLALISAAHAQTGHGQPVIEPIVATLGALPPGNVFEAFYPNEFDLTLKKRVSFVGAFTNANIQQPAFVDVWFDWIDPRDPAGTPPHTTGIFPVDLAPGQVKTFLAAAPITTLLPFCPPQVSIHIQNNGPGQPVIVDGTFIHQCLIPEPATLGLAGLCSLGLVALRRKRRCT